MVVAVVVTAVEEVVALEEVAILAEALQAEAAAVAAAVAVAAALQEVMVVVPAQASQTPFRPGSRCVGEFPPTPPRG